MPKLSIIVPVYNSSKYLRNCLDSLVNQVLDDYEIIFIDDASTDDSLEILKEYEKNYKNILVLHNDVNLGQGASRNRGIDVATGEYIGFVDSDDCVDLSMYRHLLAAAHDNEAEIATCGIKFINTDDDIPLSNTLDTRWKAKSIEMKETPEQLLWESPSSANKIFKASLIGDYRFLEDCKWEDVAFTYSMMMKSNRIASITDNLYFYRKGIENSVSSAFETSRLTDAFRVADEIEDFAKRNGCFDLYSSVIPYIEFGVTLRRLDEINRSNIDSDYKDELMQKLYREVVSRYGSPYELNTDLLSSEINMILVDQLQENSKKVK